MKNAEEVERHEVAYEKHEMNAVILGIAAGIATVIEPVAGLIFIPPVLRELYLMHIHGKKSDDA